MRRLVWPTRLHGTVASSPDDDDVNWWLHYAEQTLDHFYAAQYPILKRRRFFRKRRQRLHMPLRQMLIHRQTLKLYPGWR